MQAAPERIQPYHDLTVEVDRYGTTRYFVTRSDTGERVFRAEVREPEPASRYTAARPASVSFHSSSSRGEDAEATRAIATALHRAAQKAAQLDAA